MEEIESRRGGVWGPRPGSVYPALQQLEDEGLVRSAEAEGGRKAFELTGEGRAYVERHADELTAPWDARAATRPHTMGAKGQLFGQGARAAGKRAPVARPAPAQPPRQAPTPASRDRL